MSQIFAFGDSITWGSWDIEGGWADRLKREIIKYLDSLEEEKEIIFYNLGIPSNRTDHLAKRFQFEVEQRYDEDNQEKYFIFAFGANDAAYDLQNGKFRLDINEFKNNIIKTIESAQSYTNNIAILNITPVDESKTDGVLNKTKSRKNEYVDKYNNELAKICNEKNIELIDVNTEIKKDPSKLLYEDGLHLNSDGHKVVLDLVKNWLISKRQLS